MKNTQSFKFEHIDNLHIFDLKAQKKNINYKKFFDIPLTFEEKIANRIQMERQLASQKLNQTVDLFKKKSSKLSLKTIQKLANPKRCQQNLPNLASADQLVGIIKKCDRLKSRLLTDKKLCRFEKDSTKSYNYLFELSNFNFQKYQND